MVSDSSHDEEVRSIPQNRSTAPSKLRRDGKHCPVCLAPLKKNARRSRRVRECKSCGAQPQPTKSCIKCSGGPVWRSKAGAACQACGHHGLVAAVLAPNPSLNPDPRERGPVNFIR